MIEFGILCGVIGAVIGAAGMGLVVLAMLGRRDRDRDSVVAALLTAGAPLALAAVAAEVPAAVEPSPAVVASWWRRGLRSLSERPWGETSEARRLRLGRERAVDTAVVLAEQAVAAEVVPDVEPEPVPAEAAVEALPVVPQGVRLLAIAPPAPEPSTHYVDPITGRVLPNWARFSNIWPAVTPAPAPSAADRRTGVAA